MIAFPTELKESATFPLFGVGAKIAFFFQDRHDVYTLLEPSFVVQVY